MTHQIDPTILPSYTHAGIDYYTMTDATTYLGYSSVQVLNRRIERFNSLHHDHPIVKHQNRSIYRYITQGDLHRLQDTNVVQPTMRRDAYEAIAIEILAFLDMEDHPGSIHEITQMIKKHIG